MNDKEVIKIALDAMQKACDQDRDLYVDFGVAMTVCRESLSWGSSMMDSIEFKHEQKLKAKEARDKLELAFVFKEVDSI